MLYSAAPDCPLPNVIRLWGHVGRGDTAELMGDLVNYYLPALQRLYAIPLSAKEAKEDASAWLEHTTSHKVCDETPPFVSRSCGVQRCYLYEDFQIDEMVHRSRGGNWPTQQEKRIDGKVVRWMETKSVLILYSVHPRAHGPFD